MIYYAINVLPYVSYLSDTRMIENEVMEEVNESRRNLFLGSAAMVASGMLLGVPELALAGSTVSATELSVLRLRQKFVSYMQGLGYSEIPSKPLILSDAFVAAVCKGTSPSAYTVTNGGLRYDDELSGASHSSFVFQPAARIEDIPKKGLPNVLPYFTIAGIEGYVLPDTGALIDLILDFLINDVHLSVRNLSVTSTELISPYKKNIMAFGIPERNITIRNLNSAKVAGQGSGWFVNPVTGYSSPSLSIEYQRGRQQQEIAEIGIMDTVRSDFRGQVGCIGLERVAWAQTGQMFSWEQRLPSLLAAIRAEAQARALPLPIGYTNFLESV